MYLKPKFICLAIVLFVLINNSSEYCAKFGRHLLQHQCVLTPESTEGPYYLPKNIIRRDIREDRKGLPFKLKFTITDVNTCEPLTNVSVDVWQCDASGEYSSYVRAIPRSALHAQPTDNTTFLRGVQMTDKNGRAEFMTIFPGWYDGRTTHIHIQTHLGGKTLYTGQLYFPEKLLNRIGRYAPYNLTKNRRQKNEEDFLFQRYSGKETVVHKIKPLKGKRIQNGLNGEIIIGLDPNEESKNALHGRSNRK